MAVKEVRVDDLSGEGGADVERTYLTYQGGLYAIDLSAENRRELDAAVERFARVAVRLRELDDEEAVPRYAAQPAVSAQPARPAAPKASGGFPEYSATTARDWAHGANIPVSPQGRIARKVLEVFFLANGSTVESAQDAPSDWWEARGREFAEHLNSLGIEWDEYVASVGPDEQGDAESTSRKPVARAAVEYPEYLPENVRAWAASAGIPVSDRGRIAKPILDAFFRENGIDDDQALTMPAKVWERRGEEYAKRLEMDGVTWEDRSMEQADYLGY